MRSAARIAARNYPDIDLPDPACACMPDGTPCADEIEDDQTSQQSI